MSKPDTLDNQSSLCDDEGPIPEFPALAVDSSSGRILPISEEQRAARREAAIRALSHFRDYRRDRRVASSQNVTENRPLGGDEMPCFLAFRQHTALIKGP